MAFPFDCSRSAVLNYEFPLPLFPGGHTTGSTNSTWGQRWTALRYWSPAEIASEFNQYWNSTVSAEDKNELIYSRTTLELIIASLGNQQHPATDEYQIRQRFDAGISWVHRIAISSDNNQRPPSDIHSTFQAYQNIVFGEPDYLLQNPITLRVTGICEAKCPWNIGPSEIDDVISGKADTNNFVNGIDHAGQTSAGRLAVEQVYGYMCWNSFPLGILTTTTGFVFLKREDGGVLYLSRIYGSHRDLAPFQYVTPQSIGNNISISHMLYWFTAMTEQASLIPESRLQQAIQVMNAQRVVANLPPVTTRFAQSVPIDYVIPQAQDYAAGGPTGPMFSLQIAEDMRLYFKPWIRENHCGGRAWKGQILPEQAPVVVKCWDSHKHNVDSQKAEADTYLKLQELWGICVPKFIALGIVGFCHVIILEHIDGVPLSKENICASVEDKVKKAFLELHSRKVLHGDVRASNILVSGQSVYIIDFESARTASEEFLKSEMSEVERLFKKVRNELNSMGPTLS